jgi:hypothetical protein
MFRARPDGTLIDASALGALAAAQTAFAQKLGEFTLGPIVIALRTLCYANVDLAYDLWVELFPHIWYVCF